MTDKQKAILNSHAELVAQGDDPSFSEIAENADVEVSVAHTTRTLDEYQTYAQQRVDAETDSIGNVDGSMSVDAVESVSLGVMEVSLTQPQIEALLDEPQVPDELQETIIERLIEKAFS